MKQDMEASGKCKVPGIEALGIGPANRELRYFRREQGQAAEYIADIMARSGVKPTVQYIDRYEKTDRKQAVPSHFEIWFEPAGQPVQNLVAKITSEGAQDRRVAVSQLVTQYSDSPDAIREVLDLRRIRGEETVRARDDQRLLLPEGDRTGYLETGSDRGDKASHRERPKALSRRSPAQGEISAVEKLLSGRLETLNQKKGIQKRELLSLIVLSQY